MTAAGAERSLETGPVRQHRLAEEILRLGVVAAAAGVAVQTVVDLVNFWGFDRGIDLLNADSDVGVFAWASIAATFAAALGALLLSLVSSSRRRLLLWFVALAAAFLSLDDQVQLHERAGGFAERAEGLAAWEPARLLWPVLFFPLLAAVFLGLWTLARSLPWRESRLLLGGLLLLGGAVALELVSAVLVRAGFERGSLVYELQVLVEEGAELAGWTLAATALLAAFAREAVESAATIPREGG